MQNHKTITYTISEPGFKYHITKGLLRKGSHISKNVHPMDLVNKYRYKLLTSKLLVDKGDYYELVSSVKIGALMAYNLYLGTYASEFSPGNELVINHRDTKIIDEFKYHNVYLTNSDLRINECRDATELVGIYDISVDFKLLSDHNQTDFSGIEKIFYDVLIEYGIIDISSYHGNANLDECDIVDEVNSQQIEIVTEFKNRIKGDKTPHKNLEIFLLEAINNNFIQTSDPLIKKFTTKNYTDKYEKSIGIFCFGSQDSIATMLKVLEENIKKNKIKNNYKRLYLLWYDIYLEKYFFYSEKTDIIELNNISLRMVTKREISFDNMDENIGYLIILRNIFKNQVVLSYMTKEDTKIYLKQLNINVSGM